jgi:hypothetical protein
MSIWASIHIPRFPFIQWTSASLLSSRSPRLIKPAEEKTADHQTLQALSQRPDATADQRKRIECDGRVAQIDHLLINRVLEFYVCESKRFGEGIAINDQGEFTAFYNGRACGVPSPLGQNRRHIAVLGASAEEAWPHH